MDNQLIEMYLRQYKSHTKTLANGDKAICVRRDVWDIFKGKGWHNRVRLDRSRSIFIA